MAAPYGTDRSFSHPLRAERSEIPDDTAPTSGDSLADAKPVALARTPVSREDVFLYHKTTHRETYDARRAEWPAVWDVLLWNGQREITEFTIGNVVFELNGELVTPPRDCGLLAGAFRAELLERGVVREHVLRVDDLPSVSLMWLVNSLRGWVPVRLS